MLRVAGLFAFFALILQAATAQISSTGVPASALSPTLDNRHIPIPAGATSPQPFPLIVKPFPQRGFVRSFEFHPPQSTFGIHHHRQFLPQIPVFFPVYVPPYDYYAYPPIADPMVRQEVDAPPPAQDDAALARSEDALRQAYLQGARDALAQEQRGREDALNLMASRSAAAAKAKGAESEASPPQPDNSPAAVFIFKDGRQIETKNYAIMGQTLYDFSGSVLRKVPLTDLDTAATLRANDDRGITVKLP